MALAFFFADFAQTDLCAIVAYEIDDFSTFGAIIDFANEFGYFIKIMGVTE
jgi:hypothetical protein